MQENNKPKDSSDKPLSRANSLIDQFGFYRFLFLFPIFILSAVFIVPSFLNIISQDKPVSGYHKLVVINTSERINVNDQSYDIPRTYNFCIYKGAGFTDVNAAIDFAIQKAKVVNPKIIIKTIDVKACRSVEAQNSTLLPENGVSHE